MKYIIAIMFLIGSVFAQNPWEMSREELEATLVFDDMYSDGTLCNCDSIVTTYTAQETIDATGYTDIEYDGKREIPFKNGKVHGVWKRYSESGSIQSELMYVKGKRHGTWKMYYESGNLLAVSVYKNGMCYGTEKYYYESGSLEMVIPCDKSGTTGTIRYYYESGALYSTEDVVSGLPNGKSVWYFENGKVAGTATYKNGELVGYKKCTDGRFGNESLECVK